MNLFLAAIVRSELLLQQAGVAGDTLPAAFDENPGVGETPDVLVWLARVRPFCAVGADDNGRVSVHADFRILNGQGGEIELRIFDVSEKLGPVADLAVVLRIHEIGPNHGIERAGIAIHLGLVPQVFHQEQPGWLGVVSWNLPGLAERGNSEKKPAASCLKPSCLKHGRARPHHPHVKQTLRQVSSGPGRTRGKSRGQGYSGHRLKRDGSTRDRSKAAVAATVETIKCLELLHNCSLRVTALPVIQLLNPNFSHGKL